MTAPRRRAALAVAILVATFATGVVAGLGAARHLRPPPPAARLPPGLAELGLSSAQRAAIDAIIARHGPEAEALMAEALPRLRALQARVTAEIDAVLDPQQRAAFARQRAAHPGPPPLPPPPR